VVGKILVGLWVGAGAGVLAFLAADQPARAADPVDVESLIREGMDLRRQGKDERALPFFQKAYATEHTPRTAGQLGLAEMATGYWLSAESHIAEGLESPEHPWIAKNRQVLSQALEQVSQKIGEITIAGGPVGAAVRVNGSDVGTFPLSSPVRLSEGRAQIDVTAAGYQAASQKLHVGGGKKERLTINLAPAAAPRVTPAISVTATAAKPPPWQARALATSESSGATPPLAAADDQGPGPAELSSARPSTATEPAAAPSSAWAYGTAAAAGASIVFAVVETSSWKNKESEFSSHTGPPATLPSSMTTVECGKSDPGRGAVGCSDIYDAGRRAWALSLVGYGLGTALAATSIYLFVAHRDSASSDSQLGLACAPSIGLPGASCDWRF
jgi:hypothetical protein